jgi:hypothetical protein
VQMTPSKSQMIAAILAFLALATGADAARRQRARETRRPEFRPCY